MSSIRPDRYVRGFDEIGQADLPTVGGKGANLGELSRIDGIGVPVGFCVTSDAFASVITQLPQIDEHLDVLAGLAPGDRDGTGTISAKLRGIIEGVAVPEDVASEISEALARLGDEGAYAVRSSATAEDLPTMSFAGQHDSFLHVIGRSAVLEAVRRCWASVFTERAVSYRQHNDIDHRSVRMAVVVQRQLAPYASGVMFTADPVSGDRTVVAVEACVGLGEALVSGIVVPDVFRVRDGATIETAITSRSVVIHTAPGGGTQREELDPASQRAATLTDDQVLRLASLGRRIEDRFGLPQDIEWCLVEDDFQIVQSRPITTLFPIPPSTDDANHVYVSVGHQQMMTDAMRPLGLSLWQMTTPAPMSEAGGRLFVDVTARLASPSSRADILELFGRSDPLLRDALETVAARDGFIPSFPDDGPAPPPPVSSAAPIDTDPALVRELIAQSEQSVEVCRRDIESTTGAELLGFIASDTSELRRLLFEPRSHQVFMTAMDAAWWINEHLFDWLGERSAADILTKSVPNNVTSEMGLALLDVADAIRPYPDVVDFLGDIGHDALTGLEDLDGGPEVRAAIDEFLGRYGMRCAGEIDITRPRWSEEPTTLIPLLLAHVKNMEPGEAQRRYQEGQREALAKEHEVLDRLRALPDGDEKAAETAKMIDRLRRFIGYREYPKYAMVSRYFIYKQALMAEAQRLVEQGVLVEAEDIFYLRFDELHEVVRTGHIDEQIIARRKDAFDSHRELSPPRVLTSHGEAITGSYRRDDVPEDALTGLAVSTGTVEGRARVVTSIADAGLEPGDILVTAYTDPGWTPLFATAAGLITEVGGAMTHGAVIAREYGLPAVVGVSGATDRIRDGQRVRLNGTDGYVMLLDPSDG